MPIDPTSGGFGGFGILGGLLFPLSMALAWRRQPSGPVGALLKAGATTPELARKPRTVGIARADEYRRFLRSGVVRELPDGRLWVDPSAVRRTRIRLVALAGGLALLVTAGLWAFARAVGLA